MALNKNSFEIKQLIRLGFLVPVDSVGLYHGRSNTTGEQFRVDPSHAGRGATVPNMSLATSFADAEFVANDRASKEGGVAEVHKFVMVNGEGYFLNTDLNFSAISKRGAEFSTSDKRSIRSAVKKMEDFNVGESGNVEKLVADLGESVAVDFYQRALLNDIYEEIISLLRTAGKGPFILENDIDEISEKVINKQMAKNKSGAIITRLDREMRFKSDEFASNVKNIVAKFAGSINARLWLFDNPARAILGYMMRPDSTLVVNMEGFGPESIPMQSRHFSEQMFATLSAKKVGKIPINWEYFATWLKKNKIVGGISTRGSDTVGGKTLPVYFAFDFERLNTEAYSNEVYANAINKYGELLDELTNFTQNGVVEQTLKEASPEECIEFINKNKTYPNIANMKANVSEGYTVGEHTEAALRLYEQNFASTLPEDLQAFMKLSILLHDIGKGMAVAERIKQKGRKAEEQEETEKVCRELFKEFGFEQKAAELLIFVIGESQEYTTRFYILREADAEQKLLEAIKNKYKQIYGVDPTEQQINGIASMCKILQFCDSYSYTPGAVIRQTDGKRSTYVRGVNDDFADNSVKGKNTLEYTRPDGGEHPSDPYSGTNSRKK